jgi:asparagine synthase (glutamine-hydrolysing)
VLSRPKAGFVVPIDEWLRGSLRDLIHDVLFSAAARSRGYFNPGLVRTLVDEHMGGRRGHPHLLWTLLMLELWHQMFIDQRPAAAPAVLQPAALSV